MDSSPYSVYAEETILNASPLGLVIALYEGAITSCASARRSLLTGDIPARTKAINKAMNIVNELLCSLNDEKGGEVSVNLRRLYVYIQSRIIEAHTKKKAECLAEVENLLAIMLDGWKAVDSKFDPCKTINAALGLSTNPATIRAESANVDGESSPYGGYLSQTAEPQATSAYSF